jgi:integrase
MKNDAKSEYSIKFADKALTYIGKHASLNEPEQAKRFIANLNVSNGYKRNLSITYNKYCKYYNIKWEMPLYKQESKAIKIPTKEKIEMLIAYAGKTLSAKLTLSMETGLRPIELHNLKVKDVDLEQKLVYPNTAKHGASRKLKISERLRTILQDHINTDKLNPNDKLFQDTAEGYGKHY